MPDQWDDRTCRVIKHPQKQYLNAILAARKNEWDMAIIELAESGEAKKTKSATELKAVILRKLSPEDYREDSALFLNRFEAYAESRATPGIRSVYTQTIARMKAYDGRLASRTFEEIDFKWLSGHMNVGCYFCADIFPKCYADISYIISYRKTLWLTDPWKGAGASFPLNGL